MLVAGIVARKAGLACRACCQHAPAQGDVVQTYTCDDNVFGKCLTA